MADSIVKDIYNDIKAELATLTEIGTNVDLYKNQIAALTTFPCVLIDFPYIYYKDASARVQLGHTMARIMLCMDTADLTGAAVTDVFELKDKIYAKLQGVRKNPPPPPPPLPPANDKPKYAPLTRGTERTELKYTGVYVLEMDFYTTIQDDGVYVLKNHIAKTNVALDMNKGAGGIELQIENLAANKNNEIRTGKIV